MSAPAIASAQGQARVRITRDHAPIWRTSFQMPILIARSGQELEVLSRQGDWYQVVVPARSSVPSQTGFVHVADTRLISGAPRVSTAQPRGAPRPLADRGFVTFGGGMRVTSSSTRTAWTESVSLETASYSADYAVETGPTIGGGGAVKLLSNLAAFVTVSRFSSSGPAAVDLSVPHPFSFNAPRTASGESSSLTRAEVAVDLDAMWIAPVTRSWEVAVFGGATLFHASQEVVSRVVYNDPYPHDAIAFASVNTERLSDSPVGMNAGVDVTYRLRPRLGVAGGIRYSHAKAEFVRADGTATSATLGGTDVNVSLRVRF